jgi:hypothetical protein
VRNPNGTSHLLLQGLRRVRFERWHTGTRFPMADLEWLATEIRDLEFCRTRANRLVKTACHLAKTHGGLCDQFREHLAGLKDPEPVVDLIAFNFIRCPSRIQELVECPALDDRLEIVEAELARMVV